MTANSVDQALENIYTSVNGNNEDLDLHINALKKALDGKNEVTVDQSRLVHGNRESRKRMQAYFRQRGLKVSFS